MMKLQKHTEIKSDIHKHCTTYFVLFLKNKTVLDGVAIVLRGDSSSGDNYSLEQFFVAKRQFFVGLNL